MKKMILVLCTLAALTMLVACGATYYTVTTNTGKSYTAAEQPKLNSTAKTYTFKDPDGHVVILNQSEVTEIKSMSK